MTQVHPRKQETHGRASASPEQATPGRHRFIRAVLLLSAALVFFIPLDYVDVSSTLRMVIQVALVCGVVAVLWLVLVEQDTVGIGFIAAVGFFSSSVALVGSSGAAGFAYFIPLIVGFGVARFITFTILNVAAQAVVIVLVLESLLRSYWYSALFGELLFAGFANGEFRARGIFGQAVPSGLLGVSLLFGLALWSVLKHKKPLFIVFIAEGIVIGLLTGTRSSLILCAVALVVLAVAWGITRRGRSSRVAVAVPVVVLSAIGLFLVPSSIWSSRLFDFSSISDSASGIVRGSGLQTISGLRDGCGAICNAFGHGVRDLQTQLSGGAGVLGFNTIDNMYLSFYWDFGIAGLALLAIAAVVLLKKLPRLSAPVSAFALMGMLILVSGVFYDALYTRPTLLVFGIALGAVLLRREQTDRIPR